MLKRARSSAPRLPAALTVLLAVGGLVLLVLTTVLMPGRSAVPEVRADVGELENVRITSPDGVSRTVLARISTGVAGSSIDRGLAAELGLSSQDSDRVTVTSATGVQVRDRAPATVQLAGQPQSTRLTIVDVLDGEPPVLLGRSELSGVLVAPGQSMLTTPGPERAAGALGAFLAQSTALSALQVLALMPVAAMLVVLLRTVVGLRTLGTFSPVLLSLGYTQSGLVAGLGLTAMLVVGGLLLQPVLKRSRMPRVARLAVLVGLVSVLLVAFTVLAGPGAGSGWSTALPIVVTAVVIERLWETADLEGWRPAGAEGAVTLAVAVAVTGLLFVPVVGTVADAHPLAVAAGAAVLAAVTGLYRGPRVLDRWRSTPVDATALAVARTTEVPTTR